MYLLPSTFYSFILLSAHILYPLFCLLLPLLHTWYVVGKNSCNHRLSHLFLTCAPPTPGFSQRTNLTGSPNMWVVIRVKHLSAHVSYIKINYYQSYSIEVCSSTIAVQISHTHLSTMFFEKGIGSINWSTSFFQYLPS